MGSAPEGIRGLPEPNQLTRPPLFCIEEQRMPDQSVNPFNGEFMRKFGERTEEQMEQMLATADGTFREVWPKKPVRKRTGAIGKAALLMLDQERTFARLAALEMGKR